MEVRPLTERTGRIDLFDENGSFVGKANVGVKIMLADGFYVPERACRDMNPPSCRNFKCSECGDSIWRGAGVSMNYCPMCGARVEVDR